MIPKKCERFSEKIMRHAPAKKRFPPIAPAHDPDYQIAGTEIYCGAG
jgi:hypothetical protein